MSGEWFTGTFQGVEVDVFREYGGHRFDDREVAVLLDGGWVKFEATSKSGRSYEAVGHLVLEDGRCRFSVDFDHAPAELMVPDEWGGHRFTEHEKQVLANGGTVYCADLVSSKTGKYYSSEVEFATERGKKRIRPVRGAW